MVNIFGGLPIPRRFARRLRPSALANGKDVGKIITKTITIEPKTGTDLK